MKTDAAPQERVCLNCGAELRGRYCHECGQAEQDQRLPLKALAHVVVHEVAHVDHKILHTLRLLVCRPGALTEDFLAGRRARHVRPLRLYLVMSFLLVAALTIFPLFGEKKNPGKKDADVRLELNEALDAATANARRPTPKSSAAGPAPAGAAADETADASGTADAASADDVPAGPNAAAVLASQGAAATPGGADAGVVPASQGATATPGGPNAGAAPASQDAAVTSGDPNATPGDPRAAAAPASQGAAATPAGAAGAAAKSAPADPARARAERIARSRKAMDAELRKHPSASLLGARIKKAQQNPEAFRHVFLSSFSKALFVLMPLFAALLHLTYLRRDTYFVDHLVLSLHHHTFCFVVVIALCVLAALPGEGWGTIPGLLLLAVPPFHLGAALRRLHGQSRLKSVLKAGLVSAAYGVFLGAAVVFLLYVSLPDVV